MSSSARISKSRTRTGAPASERATTMKDPFDIDRIHDVPDPLAGLSDWPVPPRREAVLANSPTRSRVATIRATALGAALLYEMAWVVIMSKREDLHTMPRTILVTE